MNSHSPGTEIRWGLPAAVTLLLLSVLVACDGGAGGSEEVPGEGVQVLGTSIRIDLTSVEGKPLTSAGGFVYVPEARTLAINASGTIRAFASACGEGQCDVQEFDGQRMTCPCDGSRYDPAGTVMDGPSTTALHAYSVSRSGNFILILREAPPQGPTTPTPPPYSY